MGKKKTFSELACVRVKKLTKKEPPINTEGRQEGAVGVVLFPEAPKHKDFVLIRQKGRPSTRPVAYAHEELEEIDF